MFHVIHQPAVEVSQPFGEPMTHALCQSFKEEDQRVWGALLTGLVKPWRENLVTQACHDGCALPPAASNEAMIEAWQRGMEAIEQLTVGHAMPEYLIVKAELVEQLANEYARTVHQNIPGGVGARIADRQRKLTLLLAGRLRGLAGG